MIECRQNNKPLYIGAVVAIGLHLLIGFPMLTASWGVGSKSPLDSALDGKSAAERRQRERVEKALAEHQQSQQDDEVVPGLEDGSDQGMTWIGYDEYQEHLAQHATIDQAAFTEKDASGGGALAAGQVTAGPAAAPTQPTPAVEAVSAAGPLPTEAPSDLKGVTPTTTPESDLPTAPLDPEGVLPPAVDRTDVQQDPSKDSSPTAPVKPSETPDAFAREAVVAQPPVQPPAPAATESTGAAGATSPVVAPVAGPPGAPGTSQEQGEKSDRESDATSIVDVPPSLWRTGKPLARKGLEIKTRRPEFYMLTEMTTSPRNPTGEIRFGRDGVPVTCKIVESSGVKNIDDPVLDALYRWRAKGSQLDKLAPGKTLTFRVRIILH
ncbi:MAG: hypothetical protein EXS01_00005 [Phycisphaerales bacterium]|nr:hypothetical protein [Phycisphaerales bacterium]